MSDQIPAITTYMERGVHLAMKRYFCPDESCHERRIGKYVADAFDGQIIFEIQTGSFSPLCKKIQFYLENTDFDVVIVRPLAFNRRIIWLDEKTGDVAKKPRLSSKHETLISALPQIFYLKKLIGDPRVSFCFPLLEISELRLLNGYGKDKKKRSTSIDKIAGEMYDIQYISSVDDIRQLIRPRLPDSFSRAELSRALGLKGRNLWAAQTLLTSIGIISAEKKDNRLIFTFIDR